MHTKGSFHSHESFLRTKIAHAAAPKSLADGRWLFASSCSSLQFPSASIYWAHTLSPCARLCDGFKIKGTLVSDCKIGPWLQMIFNLTCWMEQVTKMRPWGHEVPPTSCDKRALKKNDENHAAALWKGVSANFSSNCVFPLKGKQKCLGVTSFNCLLSPDEWGTLKHGNNLNTVFPN